MRYEATFLTDFAPLAIGAFLLAFVMSRAARTRGLEGETLASADRTARTFIYALAGLFVIGVEISTFFQLPHAVAMMRTLPAAEGMNGTEFMWHGYFHWPLTGLCRAVNGAVGIVQDGCARLEPSSDPKAWWPWWPIAMLMFLAQFASVHYAARFGFFLGARRK